MKKPIIPKHIGTIQGKGVHPPFLEDELILLLNYFFPNQIYKFDAGMTKTTVIVTSDENWVYKFPHNGIYKVVDGDYDDISAKYYFEDLKDNACLLEINTYNSLPSNLKRYFLPLFKYQKIGNFCLYKQKRATILSQMKEQVAASMPLLMLRDRLKYKISSFWLEKAIERYGIESVLLLVDFLNDNKNIAIDLNTDNLGFDDCGNPIIVDYSGLYSIKGE